MYTKDADNGIWVKDKETVLVFIFIVTEQKHFHG